MKHLYESDKHDILSKIDYIYATVNNRLLPTFASIEKEAEAIEQARIEKLSENFNPDYMDEADILETAFHAGVEHYIIETEMKREFIKSALTWLFHLFEKDCSYVFLTEDGNKKKAALAGLGINTSKGSEWYTCNKEMRILANAIKHGAGTSLNQLKLIRPDLFKNVSTIISDNKIELNEVELGKYVTAMKNFWKNVFHQAM